MDNWLLKPRDGGYNGINTKYLNKFPPLIRGCENKYVGWCWERKPLIFDEYLPKWNYRAVPENQQNWEVISCSFL